MAEDFKFISVTKRLDASNVANFKSEALTCLDGDSPGLVISFEETDFLDSAGLGALVSILKTASQMGRKKIALAALSSQVRQIFELTKLYRLFDIYDTVDDAKTALKV